MICHISPVCPWTPPPLSCGDPGCSRVVPALAVGRGRISGSPASCYRTACWKPCRPPDQVPAGSCPCFVGFLTGSVCFLGRNWQRPSTAWSGDTGLTRGRADASAWCPGHGEPTAVNSSWPLAVSRASQSLRVTLSFNCYPEPKPQLELPFRLSLCERGRSVCLLSSLAPS